ncbi:hypothetical protein [Paenibacillus tyrfis]|uniref:hypothetical protein n=1 Tax=Paenibacillus tyrfis TaxID=1501230 RepID=UPI0020A13A0A|nr:hypothetical protein [Paenibacillus tyrfis]MCP1309629.1 hypothetical protein [Paenibacillus tyrfis]
MKKILSFAMFFAFILVFMIPISASAATVYTGGLLDGVKGSHQSGSTFINYYTKITDNDEKTSDILYGPGESNGNAVVFTLNNANIAGIRLKADGAVTVRFLDASDKVVYTSTPLAKDGSYIAKTLTGINKIPLLLLHGTL